MRKIYKLSMAVFALAFAMIISAKAAWADSFTMADIALMEYRLGPDGAKYTDWYRENSESDPFGQDDSGYEDGWNTVFVCWCADQLGYITRNCFPMANSADELLRWFTENGYQMYSDNTVSSAAGRMNIRPGDIVLIPSEGNGTEFDVGIVTSAAPIAIDCIMGDVDGTIQLRRLDSAANRSDILFFPVIPLESSNYGEIVRFLIETINLNPAAVSGIVANMVYESNGMPDALGDNGTSYGICQWHDERWQQLINYCNAAGYDWTSLDGQMMFLWYELNTQYADLKNILVSCQDNPDGAYKAGYAFCLSYESPQDSSAKAEIRAAEAMYNIYPSLFE